MKSLTQNILALASGEIIYRLIGFLTMIYLARTLGQEGFGILQFSLAVLSYAMIASNNGLTVIGTRQIAAQTGDPAVVTGNVILLRVIHAATAYTIIVVLFFLLSGNTELFVVNAVFLLSLLPAAVLLEWYFQGKEQMILLSAGRILGVGAYFLFVLFFVTSRDHLLQAPLGYGIGMAINALFLLIVYFSGKGIFRIDFRTWKILWTRSVSVTLSSSLAQLALQLPPIFLALLSTFETAGIYGVAFRLISVMLIFDRVLSFVFYPAVCRWIRNKQEFAAKLQRAVRLILTGSVLFSLTILFLSDFLILKLFGAEWTDSVVVFRWFTAYAGLTFVNSAFSYTLLGLKKEYIYFRILIWATLGGVGLMFILVPLLNAVAPVFGLMTFELVTLGLMNYHLRDTVPISIFSKTFGLLIFAAGIGYLLIEQMDWPAWINWPVGVVLIIPLMIRIIPLRWEDLTYLKRTVL